MAPGVPQGSDGSLRGLLGVVCRTKLYVLLLVCVVFSMGLSSIVPVLPSLATNFFASQHAGAKIDCEQLDVQPLACQEAHADVVRWTSLNSLAANTFIAFFFAPLVGDLSDAWGRRPFIAGGIALNVLPLGAVWLHLAGATSLLLYYPLNALTAAVSPVIAMLSYAADVLAPEQRTAGFGLVTAAFSCGYVLGPALCSCLRPDHTALVAAGAMLVALLLVLVALPESRPPARGGSGGTAGAAPAGAAGAQPPLGPSPAHHRRRSPWDAFLSMGRSWRLINSSSLFRRLALCMAVVGVVSEGIQDMLLQYLQLVVGFNTPDTTVLIIILGVANFVVQALLLPGLTRVLGERRLLLLGLAFSMAEQLLLTLAATKAQAVAAVSLSAFAGVSFPAISSLKSTHASPEQQGLVQGALAGIRALSSGLGPLGLAQLFAMSTTAEALLGYHPGLVFMTTCALTVVAAAVAASIPAEAAKIPPGGAAQQPTGRGGGGASDGCAAAAWMAGADAGQCHKAAPAAAGQHAAGAEAALGVAALAACAGGAPAAAHAVHEAVAEAQSEAGGVVVVVAPEGGGHDGGGGGGPDAAPNGRDQRSQLGRPAVLPPPSPPGSSTLAPAGRAEQQQPQQQRRQAWSGPAPRPGRGVLRHGGGGAGLRQPLLPHAEPHTLDR